MNFPLNKYTIGAAALLLVAVILCAWAWHGGARHQAARDAAQLAKLQHYVDACAASVRQANAQAAQNMAEAKRAQAQAQDAEKAAAAEKSAHVADLDAWNKQFAKLKRAPSCQSALGQQLCTALAGY